MFADNADGDHHIVIQFKIDPRRNHLIIGSGKLKGHDIAVSGIIRAVGVLHILEAAADGNAARSLYVRLRIGLHQMLCAVVAGVGKHGKGFI